MWLSILVDVIHFLTIVIACEMFFAFDKREFKCKWLVLSLDSVVVPILSIFIHSNNNDFVETVIYFQVVILLLYVAYRESLYTIVITAIGIIFALSLIEMMAVALVNIVMKIMGINAVFMSDLAMVVITMILIYSVGLAYRKSTSKMMRKIGLTNLVGFTILLVVDSFVVTAITVLHTELDVLKYKNIYLLAIVLVIIGIFIQLASVILLFTQRNVYKEKEEITDKYLNEQKLHYEYLENRERETKKFRHDLRSHMELISNLAKNHEYEKIDDYFEQIQERIDTFGNVITVHNSIVDAIINQYYARAEQSGVTMEVKGRFPVDCNIDTYDLCTIFSNVLSNALEAAVETEEKYVLLDCRHNDKSIIISVVNSYDVQAKNGNTQWRTQKANTDYHGYGLENIQDSVNKYNGLFTIETEENMCNLKILFDNIRMQQYENINSR